MSTRTDSRYPWYKERLQWKYLANQQRQLNTLISHKWRFLVPSKEGCPEDQKLSQKPPLVLPLINTSKPTGRHYVSSKRQQNSTGSNTDICSKRTLGQQARQKRINNIERNLLETLTTSAVHDEDNDDVFETSNKNYSDEQIDKNEEEDCSKSDLSIEDVPITLPKTDVISSQQQEAIYHWPLMKSAEEIAEEELEEAKRRAVSPTQEAQVNKVTHELIEWSKNLGDDSKEYIDENTIKRLFASDYEAKPVLTAPIHIVELKNIPHELRTESRGNTGSSYRVLSAVERLKLLESCPLHAGHIRYKYGAWYLKPSQWKLRPSNEPLEDPKVVKKREEMETRMKNESLDAVLTETHGAQAFKNFVATKYKNSIAEQTRSSSIAASKSHNTIKPKIQLMVTSESDNNL